MFPLLITDLLTFGFFTSSSRTDLGGFFFGAPLTCYEYMGTRGGRAFKRDEISIEIFPSWKLLAILSEFWWIF